MCEDHEDESFVIFHVIDGPYVTNRDQIRTTKKERRRKKKKKRTMRNQN